MYTFHAKKKEKEKKNYHFEHNLHMNCNEFFFFFIHLYACFISREISDCNEEFYELLCMIIEKYLKKMALNFVCVPMYVFVHVCRHMVCMYICACINICACICMHMCM